MKEFKAFIFKEMMDNVVQKSKEDFRRFKDNGGICLHCGKNPGDSKGFNPFHCSSCNKGTENILKDLGWNVEDLRQLKESRLNK